MEHLLEGGAAGEMEVLLMLVSLIWTEAELVKVFVDVRKGDKERRWSM